MRQSSLPVRVGIVWHAIVRCFRRRKKYPYQGKEVCLKKGRHDLEELVSGGQFCRVCHQVDPMQLSGDPRK